MCTSSYCFGFVVDLQSIIICNYALHKLWGRKFVQITWLMLTAAHSCATTWRRGIITTCEELSVACKFLTTPSSINSCMMLSSPRRAFYFGLVLIPVRIRIDIAQKSLSASEPFWGEEPSFFFSTRKWPLSKWLVRSRFCYQSKIYVNKNTISRLSEIYACIF